MSTLQFTNNEIHTGTVTATNITCSGGGSFTNPVMCPYVVENYSKFVDDFYGATVSSLWNQAISGGSVSLVDGEPSALSLVGSLTSTPADYASVNWGGKTSVDITKTARFEFRMKLLATGFLVAPAQADSSAHISLESSDFRAGVGYFTQAIAGVPSSNFFIKTWDGATTTYATTTVPVGDNVFHYFRLDFANGGDMTVYHRLSQSDAWTITNSTPKGSLGVAPAQPVMRCDMAGTLPTSLVIDYVKIFNARE